MPLPPPGLTIAEEEQRFYTALGKALAQWQQVESGLAQIFSFAFGPQHSGTANVALHTILSFDTKLQMTDAALRFEMKQSPAIQQWNPLFNRASRRNKRRNLLAHFAIDFDLNRRPGYRVRMKPSYMDLRAAIKWADNMPSLTCCQIIATGESFAKLGDDLRAFSGIWLRSRQPSLAQLLALPPQLQDQQASHTPDAQSDAESDKPLEP